MVTIPIDARRAPEPPHAAAPAAHAASAPSAAAGPHSAPAPMPLSEGDKMRLWMTLIIGVLFVALASIAAAVALVVMGKPDLASAAWPIATASVAGIVGLFAKSPTSS